MGKPHPNFMKIGEHDLMSMGNKPITLNLKNNVKKMSKTSISTIRLSIFTNNSKSRHPIKNLRAYLESGHQNTSSYVVKCQKSIVDMLIVDMRRCGKYKDTHKNFHYSLSSFGEELLHAREWPWIASCARHKLQFSLRPLPGDLGLVHYYRARPKD